MAITVSTLEHSRVPIGVREILSFTRAVTRSSLSRRPIWARKRSALFWLPLPASRRMMGSASSSGRAASPWD